MERGGDESTSASTAPDGRDVETLRARIRDLEQDNSRLSALAHGLAARVDGAPIGEVVCDAHALVSWANAQARALLGPTVTQTASAASARTPLTKLMLADDAARFERFLRECLVSAAPGSAEFDIQPPNEPPTALRITGRAANDASGPVVHLVLVDIAGQRTLEVDLERARATLQALNDHDPLTRLPNRLHGARALSARLLNARADGQRVAVLYLGLDGFRAVNDTVGHLLGDTLLCQVANRLRHVCRDRCDLARMGGDEFTVVLPDLQSVSDARALARELNNAVSAPFELESHDVRITLSVGISLFPDHVTTADEATQAAEAALRKAKSQGRAQAVIYSSDLIREAGRRAQLQQDLSVTLRHLAAGDAVPLTLVYQPLVDARTRQVESVEALLRWGHPELGPVPPQEFVPIAEASGDIHALGAWVLEQAVRQLSTWAERGLEIGVAVNISTQQLMAPEFVARVAVLLKSYDVDPGLLELELTESAILDDPNTGLGVLRALREAGVRVAIDDFGTGYSSLGRQRGLPISRLKIDRVFVSALGHSTDDQAIIKAIIAMAHQLGIEVVSEGVEDRVQLDFLTANACDYLQGYLLGKPATIESVESLISESGTGEPDAQS
ncbi:MAG: EAL domain-containing protein [Pseudomonadota bacterium]